MLLVHSEFCMVSYSHYLLSLSIEAPFEIRIWKPKKVSCLVVITLSKCFQVVTYYGLLSSEALVNILPIYSLKIFVSLFDFQETSILYSCNFRIFVNLNSFSYQKLPLPSLQDITSDLKFKLTISKTPNVFFRFFRQFSLTFISVSGAYLNECNLESHNISYFTQLCISFLVFINVYPNLSFFYTHCS